MTGTRYSALELLDRLVAFQTDSSLSNLRLIDFAEDYLRSWGVASIRLPNAAGDKAALLATIGPSDRPGIVLNGHTDCVPVTGQAWSTDPFQLRIADGKAYGRGSVDMKGFDAIVLAAVPAMLAASLQRPIHILLSYDEETTCLGSIDGIERIKRDHPAPLAAIVGEPTDLMVADAHKSVGSFLTIVHGHEAHSSKPYLGASAVVAAGDVIAGLNRFSDELEAQGDPSGRFDPPFTTVQVGRVMGGTARNILAKECTIHWEFRGLPDFDEDAFGRRFAELCERVTRERLTRYGAFGRIETTCEVLVPGLAPEPGSEAERLALNLTGQNAPITVPYGTEAGRFQAAGIPTVVCGPGSINQAHQPDEYITLAALADGERFLGRLINFCRTT